MSLPDATPKPCNDCPWRKTSAPGWLGPMDADEWVKLAHSDEPIACHQTIVLPADWDDGVVRQCAGAASYRANVGKMPRDPQVAIGPKDSAVFSSPVDFSAYHG